MQILPSAFRWQIQVKKCNDDDDGGGGGLCAVSAGFGSGVHQKAAGLHLYQERVELAGRPHAGEQEEEAGGCWRGDVAHSRNIASSHWCGLPLTLSHSAGGGAEHDGGGWGRRGASAIRGLQVSFLCGAVWLASFSSNGHTDRLLAEAFPSSTSRTRCQKGHLGTLGTPTVERKGQVLRSRRSDFDPDLFIPEQDGALLKETHLTSTGNSRVVLHTQRKHADMSLQKHFQYSLYVCDDILKYIRTSAASNTLVSLFWCSSVTTLTHKLLVVRTRRWRTTLPVSVSVNSPKEMSTSPLSLRPVLSGTSVKPAVIVFYPRIISLFHFSADCRALVLFNTW